MNTKIRFHGDKTGYVASEVASGIRIHVRKGADGWSALYFKHPLPAKVQPTGVYSTGMLQAIKVDGVFKSRRLAADAGLAAYKADRS